MTHQPQEFPSSSFIKSVACHVWTCIGDGSKPCTPGKHQNSWDSWYSWSAILCGKFNGLLAFELQRIYFWVFTIKHCDIKQEKWDEYG